jgi:hypothetical protein
MSLAKAILHTAWHTNYQRVAAMKTYHVKLKSKVKQNIKKYFYNLKLIRKLKNTYTTSDSRMRTYLLLPHAFQRGMLILNNRAHANSFNISSWGIRIEIFQSRYAFPQVLQLLSKIIGSNLLLLLYVNELVEKSARPVNLQETGKLF